MVKTQYVIVDHELNKDIWASKKALFEKFYGEFYNFIKKTEDGKQTLAEHNINNVEDFYAYADYYADGRDNCYSMGFAFHKYFIQDMMNGSLDKQPETVFIGYCHKNNLFTDFIDFLITFFAWWRNDEGCTRMDPYNYADDFYVSGWASLVDTSKLFYFTAETVYWWHSYRIKYVLEHIPGTFLSDLPSEGLPKIRVAGYEFLGWYDSPSEDAKLLETTDNVEIAYGKIKRKDFYDYWGKEEKTIKKVYVEDWNKADPA